MERLPREILAEFLLGHHVMRHRRGLWNAIWSDMYIETTFMRYGKGPGGLIGITLKPSTVTRWALSLHICSLLLQDISSMTDEHAGDTVTHHKEEMPSRIVSDAKDRGKLRNKLSTSVDPLHPASHPKGLVNIVTGRIAPANVNVPDSLGIGLAQMQEFESSWPKGFHDVIPKKVLTMAVTKKHISVDQTPVYDTELIYTRVMCLQQSRDVNVEELLSYELSAVPPSMFDENGEMRITTTKSTMKRKLQVEHSSRLASSPQVTVIDGCALLWVVQWPASGTVQDYADNFTKKIMTCLQISDVHLIFDRYYKDSVKHLTRLSRAGKDASRRHQLSLDTPLPPQKVTLTVTENKVQLIDLLCQNLANTLKQLPENTKRIVITGKDPVPIEIRNGKEHERHDLKTTHEEADVIIVQHMVHLASTGLTHIRVVCDDTDVFVLLVHFYHQQNLTCELTMVSPIAGRTVFDIKATVQKQAANSEQLLAVHAMTGCDTVSYMCGIGKATALKKMQAGHLLESLGEEEADIEVVLTEATKFVGACYGSKITSTLSAIRHDVWSSKMGNPKITKAPKLKTLPPTTEAFLGHVLRAHYQTIIWKSSLQADPPALDPVQFGWSKDEADQGFVPVGLPEGVSPVPEGVLKIIRCGCSSDTPCSTARCGCVVAQLSCSVFCSCRGAEECCNERTKTCLSHVDDDEQNDEEADDQAV